MQLSGGEIKYSYQNNDKQKYHANPKHNKYGVIHDSTKKRGVGSCPYIIKNNSKNYKHESYFIRSIRKSNQ
ncbi:hypothetical protein GBF45_05595 [Salmonella enterica subsp. enterica]|nr:hypothetical protein [Salmonella enterica subsp. enterica serovar Ealing]